MDRQPRSTDVTTKAADDADARRGVPVERGAITLEYGLLLSLIAAVVVVTVIQLGDEVLAMYQAVETAFT
jgi:Flp pilus assembly pilin Flp